MIKMASNITIRGTNGQEISLCLRHMSGLGDSVPESLCLEKNWNEVFYKLIRGVLGQASV